MYTTIHKGIRSVLFDAALTVARTDFSDAEETMGAVGAVRRMLGFLEEHAEKEDAVIMPEYAALAPAVFSELQADHTRTGGMQSEIEELLERIPGAEGVERISLGERLHSKLGLLVAEHLQHMNREETNGNRALWAHRTDEELLEMQKRIVGSIPTERLALIGPFLLSAVNKIERAILLGTALKRIPPEELARIVSIAESARTAAAGLAETTDALASTGRS